MRKIALRSSTRSAVSLARSARQSLTLVTDPVVALEAALETFLLADYDRAFAIPDSNPWRVSCRLALTSPPGFDVLRCFSCSHGGNIGMLGGEEVYALGKTSSHISCVSHRLVTQTMRFRCGVISNGARRANGAKVCERGLILLQSNVMEGCMWC